MNVFFRGRKMGSQDLADFQRPCCELLSIVIRETIIAVIVVVVVIVIDLTLVIRY